MPAMKPILFGDEMVRAIREGRKDQTRRLHREPWPVGTLLYVREAFASDEDGAFVYRADDPAGAPRWKPSIHMPRVASRITLEVTASRVEPLQDISDADVDREGIPNPYDETPRAAFMRAWDNFNFDRDTAERPSAWWRNPTVAVYTFRIVRDDSVGPVSPLALIAALVACDITPADLRDATVYALTSGLAHRTTAGPDGCAELTDAGRAMLGVATASLAMVDGLAPHGAAFWRTVTAFCVEEHPEGPSLETLVDQLDKNAPPPTKSVRVGMSDGARALRDIAAAACAVEQAWLPPAPARPTVGVIDGPIHRTDPLSATDPTGPAQLAVLDLVTDASGWLRAGTITVSAPAGWGKTLLGRHIAARARDAGANVGLPDPYHPERRLVPGQFGVGPDAVLVDTPPPDADLSGLLRSTARARLVVWLDHPSSRTAAAGHELGQRHGNQRSFRWGEALITISGPLVDAWTSAPGRVESGLRSEPPTWATAHAGHQTMEQGR